MTASTPSSVSIGAATSPVNGPCGSECMFCAATRTPLPAQRAAAAARDGYGGQTTSSAGRNSSARGRSASRKASVSRTVLCIFQLAANRGVRSAIRADLRVSLGRAP